MIPPLAVVKVVAAAATVEINLHKRALLGMFVEREKSSFDPFCSA